MWYYGIYMRERPLVLLLDDEEDFLEIASTQLRSKGFETVITHSVPEALAKAEEPLPDLILSDIYMPPGPNGWDFALLVTHNWKLKNVRFAFFTSLHDPRGAIEQSELAARTELKNIPVFSKIDDVGDLGKKVEALL